MAKKPQDYPLLLEIQADKHQISKIKEQRELIDKLQESFKKKDKEIAKLNALIDKYKQYYEKYTTIKYELNEKMNHLSNKDKQNRGLKKQLEQLLQQEENNLAKIRNYEQEKAGFIRQRHTIEKFNKNIEDTYKEYQNECKNRQKALLFDLEKAYEEIRSLNQKVEKLELNEVDAKQLKEKIKILQDENKQIKLNSSRSLPKKHQSPNQHTFLQLSLLKKQLYLKQEQLQRSKQLNHELSIEYDKAVNKICQFQVQLTQYRKQNHELKKTLTLAFEQQKYLQLENDWKEARSFNNSKVRKKSKDMSRMRQFSSDSSVQNVNKSPDQKINLSVPMIY